MRRLDVPPVEARQGGFRRAARADRVLRVGALHGVVGQRQIAHRARHRPDVVEARDEGERARARQPAVGGLQPEQAAERRRHTDRAVGVGPQRQRHQSAGHRPAGAAGGAAGHVRRIVRVARRAVVHVLAGEVVGVLAHVERAHQHGAGCLQPLDQGRIGRGRFTLAVDLGARESWQPGDVEQVLHGRSGVGRLPKGVPNRLEAWALAMRSALPMMRSLDRVKPTSSRYYALPGVRPSLRRWQGLTLVCSPPNWKPDRAQRAVRRVRCRTAASPLRPT